MVRTGTRRRLLFWTELREPHILARNLRPRQLLNPAPPSPLTLVSIYDATEGDEFYGQDLTSSNLAGRRGRSEKPRDPPRELVVS